jgi:hypothetical protein
MKKSESPESVLNDGYVEQRIREISVSTLGEMFVLGKYKISEKQIEEIEIDEKVILALIFNKLELPVLKYTLEKKIEGDASSYDIENVSVYDVYDYNETNLSNLNVLLMLCKFYKQYCIYSVGKEHNRLNEYFLTLKNKKIANAYRDGIESDRLNFKKRLFDYKVIIQYVG